MSKRPNALLQAAQSLWDANDATWQEFMSHALSNPDTCNYCTLARMTMLQGWLAEYAGMLVDVLHPKLSQTDDGIAH